MSSDRLRIWRGARVLAVAVIVLGLGACAETQFLITAAKKARDDGTQQGAYKVGKPYQINGVWYYPGENYEYDETGIASWYGPQFHGKLTANGEVYDMNDVTAAHRTLPLPSYVRVTNLSNGRSVVVRVNDRGPFKGNRIIDLSRTAAAKLDMLRDGTAMVEVQSVGPSSQPATHVVTPARQFYAQVGAFREADNARRLAERIVAAGFADVTVLAVRSGARTVHRVRVGPFASVISYDSVVERLRAGGFGPVILAFG